MENLNQCNKKQTNKHNLVSLPFAILFGKVNMTMIPMTSLENVFKNSPSNEENELHVTEKNPSCKKSTDYTMFSP